MSTGTDSWTRYYEGFDGPAENASAVTPHDTNELSDYTRSLYIGGAGDLVVVTVGGDEVTFSAVPVGTVLPVRAKQVKATGTTATNIVGLW